MKKVFFGALLAIGLLTVTSCQDEDVVEPSVVCSGTRSVTPDTFDWENADWMPTPPGQSRIPTPWVGQGSLVSTWGLDVIEDRLEHGGWELLYNSFTTNAPGPLVNPYFVLYNKYRGLMRIFLYVTTEFISPSSYIEDGLSLVSNTRTTRLFDFMISDVSNPENHINGLRQIQPKPFDGSMPLASNKWYMMQYELAYDPDIVNMPYNEVQLSWTLNYFSFYNISLGGEFNGEINGTIGNGGGFDWKNESENAVKNLGKGLLTGVGISMWERAKTNNDGSNKLGLNKTVFNKIGTALSSLLTATTKGFFGNVVGALSAVIGTGQVSPTPINMSMSGTVTLEGKASTAGSFPSMPISFWIPGTNIPPSAAGYIPLYNKPLGVVNFTSRPKIHIYYRKTERSYIDDSVPGDQRVRETCEYATIHTEGIYENYLIVNPEVEKIANVDIISQEILKKHGDEYMGAEQTYKNVSYDNPYLSQTGKREIVDMDFVVRFVIKVRPKNGGDVSYIIKTLDLEEEWDKSAPPYLYN